MENKIKKILLELQDGKLYGFVVVKNESIKKYGYDKLSKDEFRKEYYDILDELELQYNDDLKGLSKQEIVNKAYKLGIIEYAPSKLITKITTYYDSDKNFIKYIVDYGSDSLEVNLKDCFDEDDFYNKFETDILKMCQMYNLEIKDFNVEVARKLDNLGLYQEIEIEKSIESTYHEDSDDIKEEVKESKIKNLVLNHKLLSGLLIAGTIILITGIHGCSKKNNNENKEIYIPDVDLLETVKPTPTAEPVIPTFEPIEYFKEIYIDNEEYLFPNYEEPENNLLVVKEVNGRCHCMGDGTYDYTFDNLNLVRNENMSSVGNYVQSNIDIQDGGNYIYYESRFFDRDIRDKAYVKYFSMIGNEIIKNAYENQDFDSVRNYTILSDESVIKLILNDEPLHVYINGCEDYISYSELSQEAKEVVLNIAWANNLPLCKEIVLSTYNQDDISNIILEQAELINIIK